MKIAVYFCTCGTNIAEMIDPELVRPPIEALADVAWFTTVAFICSEEGKTFLEEDLRKNRPDRVVIAACSPREHETTFMGVMERAGLNPYLMQMVNIREQVAWVTADRGRAVAKAIAAIRGAVARVRHHEPLERRVLKACPAVLVLGAGPAGLKAALSLAEAGRKVTLVEKEPVIGGMPARFEEVFPDMECGPCMLEPLLGEVLHGAHSGNIELLTMAELADVAGFYGNFIATIRQRPRHVDLDRCIGCGECSAACPATVANRFNCGLNERKAIDVPFTGALPAVPFLDASICIRRGGGDCRACTEACPMGEDVIDFDQQGRLVERTIGAIVVATGSSLLDCSSVAGLAYGRPEVYTALEFERILSSTGPTGGRIAARDGREPRSIAIIHCVGSLDGNHREYCSGICCQYAFKFNRLIGSRLPQVKIHHFYREIAIPGKSAFRLYESARQNGNTTMHRYETPAHISIAAEPGGAAVVSCPAAAVTADMVILCPAVTPGSDTEGLGAMLEVPLDGSGFFEELHGRMDAGRSKIRGIYLAGACQAPTDLQKAVIQGMAAAGYVLSDLAEGRKIELEPITASVDEERCAGCGICLTVCPFKAIGLDSDRELAVINPVLCHGCGTCVAGCPAGAISGNHFTNRQIMAEIEGVLQ